MLQTGRYYTFHISSRNNFVISARGVKEDEIKLVEERIACEKKEEVWEFEHDVKQLDLWMHMEEDDGASRHGRRMGSTFGGIVKNMET